MDDLDHLIKLAQNKPDLNFHVYFSYRGFEEKLASDLKRILFKNNDLIVCEGPIQSTYWAKNIWKNARFLKIESIGKAAKHLKNIGRNWFPYLMEQSRRTLLISESLAPIRKKRLVFPCKLPTSLLGGFTLIDKHTMIYSYDCTATIPDGDFEFEENKTEPPSRAYLKLWEAFTRLGFSPSAEDSCLELGASPGGWTWVLAKLGCRVTAVDRAPLEKKLETHPLVTTLKQDAFKVYPEENCRFDWLFSDLICYPEKLYSFVQIWIEKYPDMNFVCTIKLQGEEHDQWIEKFAQIPFSQVIHLYHNKHELTWVRSRKHFR